MISDTPLDYAVFQLSPKHSRCELFISRNGNTEKLASGLVKPFTAHLRVVEEQVAQAVHSIKLDVEKHRNAEAWFTKGTLERFVRFVSTPEVLEMVNTLDAEMSQLEAACKIYSQGAGDRLSGAVGGDGNGTVAGADATKKELLKAIDVRLAAVKQDLTMASARALAAGFNPETVSELQLFADCFGAHLLNEACSNFISLCQRRPDLINTWKPKLEDETVRSSWGSDMSIDDTTEEDLSGPHNIRLHQNSLLHKHKYHQAGQEQEVPSQTQHHLNQSKPSTCQQHNSSHFTEQQNVQNESKEEGKKNEEAVTEPSPCQLNPPARRLSVQDRINLFENKQKENSSGKPMAVGKSAELKRQSSDVSSMPAVEKAVLRRWSGASDMSIDLGNDKTENNNNINSPLHTPSSSSASRVQSNAFPSSSEDNMNRKGLDVSAGLVKVETKSVLGLKDQDKLQTCDDGGFVERNEEVGLKGKLKDIFGGEERSGLADQAGFEGKSRVFSDRVETVPLKSQITTFASKVGDAKVGNRIEDVKIRDRPPNQSRYRSSQTHARSLSGQFEGSFRVKVKEEPHKDNEGDRSTSQTQWRLFAGEVEQSMKYIVFSGKEPLQDEGFQVSKMKVQKPHGSSYGNNTSIFAGNKISESQESSVTVQVPSLEQVQRARQSKGNQELNDELKMKANELEKLFAEHKLRVPGDQSGSTRRNKPVETQVEPAPSLHHGKPAAVEISPMRIQDKTTGLDPSENSGNMTKFSTPSMKKVDQPDYSNSLRQNFSESDESRGKFYQKYSQKRDAKLREEWGTKRAEKESKLKAMQDSLEKSRAEMKAKFSGSGDRQDSVSSARRRAEKLRSFHIHSNINREPQQVDSFQSEEDDLSEYPEQKSYGQDRSFDDASLGDIASRSSQNKKFLPNKTLSSSTPRTSASPASRSTAKISNPSSARRRVQSENALTQSVPNFSDFRKENTKPSSGVSKSANRSQVRTYSRSKSTNEEVPLAKEEKARQSQSLRKSVGNPVEFKNLPPLNSETEQSLREKFSKNVESKPFLRKGNGLVPGVGVSITKMKGSMASETLKTEDEFEESPFEAEDSVNVTKEEEEEFKEIEESPFEVEDCANMDNGKPRTSHESDKMDMSESENGDSQRYPSQIDISSVGELPASVPSAFHTAGSLLESPGESPVSWNSCVHHPFSHPHETSDIDALMDFPIGSPASWNSRSLAQTEADAARMRKKWGNAQKPIIVAHTSHNQSRKDVTKGFKRLLKFGRKSRGTESLVDWISATTSEGDDDTEDGRDPANRSSEDLRKSRMGVARGQPSDDGFNESESFNDQAVQASHNSIPAPPANFKLRDELLSGSSIKAPRSFFSLSSFRSKGNESKLR